MITNGDQWRQILPGSEFTLQRVRDLIIPASVLILLSFLGGTNAVGIPDFQ